MQVLKHIMTRTLFTVYQTSSQRSTPTYNILFRRQILLPWQVPSPAEYFCQRAYKKLASLCVHFNNSKYLDKYQIPIKLVPRYWTEPIFYANPNTLQMFFDNIISSGRLVICKAVLLLPAFIKYLYDVYVCVRLTRLFFYTIYPVRDYYLPSTGTFKLTTCDRLHPDFKIRTIANRVGMVNCLFGRPDSFVTTIKSMRETFSPLINLSLPW